MFFAGTLFRRLKRPAPNLPALLLLAALSGCGLGDSEQADCRCGPESSTVLFARCADVIFEGDDAASPFSTQTPECPSGQQLFLLERTRPEFVLSNIRTIFSASPESRSADQYMEQLTENFSFVPDEEDIPRHPDVYDTSRDTLWTAVQERSFARAIMDPERIQSVRFVRWFQSALDQRIPSEDQLGETFIFPYELSFVEVGEAEGGEEAAGNIIGIKGFMEIDLVTPTVENPVWTIGEWRDQRDLASAKFSWGELRALFER